MEFYEWKAQPLELELPHNQKVQVSVYRVPAGVYLVRGRTSSVPDPSNKPLFFATDVSTAFIYGYLDFYQVIRPFVLLNLADSVTRNLTNNLYQLWAQHNHRNPNIFAASYPLNKDGQVVRDSSFTEDYTVVDFITDALNNVNNPLHIFDGFGTDTMQTEALLSVHHPEMLIVHPSRFVNYVGSQEQEVDEDQKLNYAHKRMERRDDAARKRAMAESRKKKQAALNQPSRAAKNLFFDDDDESGGGGGGGGGGLFGTGGAGPARKLF